MKSCKILIARLNEIRNLKGKKKRKIETLLCSYQHSQVFTVACRYVLCVCGGSGNTLKYGEALQNLPALTRLVQVVPFSLHSLTDTR